MITKAEFATLLAGASLDRVEFMPDLTLWYDWHSQRDSLPPRWCGASLSRIAEDLGVAAWHTSRLWRIETPGIDIETSQTDQERVTRCHTRTGTLTSRWAIGPDSDWWQTEYPVKSSTDLQAALELVEARTYIVNTSPRSPEQEQVGSDSILALELPKRPYSELLHDFLGWSEGLMLLGEPTVLQILAVLEAKLQQLVAEIGQLAEQVILSPDNLDGQFISPRAFRTHVAASYRHTTQTLQEKGNRLIVHIGGPVKRLMTELTNSGIDGFEGISGPPQSDLTLTQARAATGPGPALWGGIPQDFVLPTYSRQELQAAVEEILKAARDDKRMIVGIADRVPVNADPARLEELANLIQQQR